MTELFDLGAHVHSFSHLQRDHVHRINKLKDSHKTLTQQCYRCLVCNSGFSDFSYLFPQEMLEELENFSKHPAHRDVDSCIVSLLSHGIEGGVYGVDGKLLQVPYQMWICT